jgi:uncharacterized protein with PIN domain
VAKVRFLLDEHLPRAIAQALRRRGIDVVTSSDAGLLGAPDEAHLERARVEGRIVVTRDADFLRLQYRGHMGIAYYAQGSRSVGQIVTALELIFEALGSEEMRDHVEFL